MIQKSLDAGRVIGNEAVHPGTIDLREGSTMLSNMQRKVGDMQPHDFAQSMCDNYAIPDLDEIDQADGTYYSKYSSSDDWEIRIGGDKTVVFVQIPKPEQPQFN